MKRILILNYEFPPLGGGGGRVSFALGKGFQEEGYAVDVITSRYGGLPRNENVEGINVHRVKILGRKKKQIASFLSMLTFLISGSLCGIRLCRKNDYTFINTHFVLPTGPLGFALSTLFQIPDILSLHGGDIYDPSKKSSPHQNGLLRRVVRFLLRRADQVVAQSQNTKQNAFQYYEPGREIQVVPLSYEPFCFSSVSRRELGLIEDRRYIISVGRIVKRKGFDYLIKSLALLDEDVELLLIGDGVERDALQNLAKHLKIYHRIHFAGDVSEQKKFQYLSNADLYVLSSLHEGFGIVLQEAMQVGLPIVSTNYGGQIDIITNQVNGLLVEPENVNVLAEAIKQLLRDVNLYKKISSNNIEKVKEFRPDTIIRKYLQLIETV
jgi:glycosyltransferase involved in cell wall biosynthesis